MSRADFENYIKFYRLEKENCLFSRKYWEKTMSIVISQGKRTVSLVNIVLMYLKKIKKVNTFLNHNEKGRQVVFWW